MTSSPTLELRLFGRGVVLFEGQPVTLATRKALALLAFVTLEGGVARGRLAGMLWSDLPEEAARNNLRKELFRLRETPLAPLLEVTATHVALQPIHSDVAQFETLAKTEANAALELYQGEFLMGLEINAATEFEVWLEQKREYLRSIATQLWAAQATQLEASTDLRGALAAHQALLQLDGLQEVHHRQIMRLHWRLGERAAALERFDALEQMLKNEFGLKPLPETLELLERIERALPEPAEFLETTVQRPNLLRPPLVGRETAWAWLEQQTVPLRIVQGEVGVGKTRLVEDFARTKGYFLTLRGFASASNIPLYPIAETLRTALLEQRIHPENMELVWRREVARLIPEFFSEAIIDSANTSGSLGRAKFIEALTRALQATLQANEYIVLDDLHWFDPSSLEVIAHLARKHCLMLATTRDLESSENPDLQNLLSTLNREHLLGQHALPSFNENQTLGLLQSLSGQHAPLFAQRLHLASGGNPLLTLETLQGFFENGTLTLEPDGTWTSAFDTNTADYTELPIPNNVRELVMGRIHHLGAAVKRILEVAALSGDPFDAEHLLSASALSENEAIHALERATTAQLIRREQSNYRFSHDVVRRSLLEDFSPERERMIHRRLADQFIRNNQKPARIAWHLEQSGRAQEAIPWLIKAAQTARAIFAHQEARNTYKKALSLEPDNATRFTIHAQSADLALTLLDLDALEQHASTMQDLSHALPLEYSVRAQLLTAKAHLYRGQFSAALEQAQEALEEAQGETRAEALLLIGTALTGSGQAEKAREKLLEGLQIQKRGEIAAELHSSLKEVYRRLNDLPKALEQAERAYSIYKGLRQREQEITELAQVGQLLGLLGRNSEALDRLQRATKLAREYDLERVLTVSLVLLCAEQLRAGLFSAAKNPITEGLSLTQGKMLARECQFTAMLSRVQYRTGQLKPALENAHLALTQSQTLSNPAQTLVQHLWLADAYLGLQASAKALEHLEQAELLLEQAGQSYIAPIAIHRTRAALQQKNITLATALLSQLEPQIRAVQLEYRVYYACCLASANQEAKAVFNDLPQLPNWLEARMLLMRSRIGEDITDRAEKLLKSLPTSLEALWLSEVLATRVKSWQKKHSNLRHELEKHLGTEFGNLGTFLERPCI